MVLCIWLGTNATKQFIKRASVRSRKSPLQAPSHRECHKWQQRCRRFLALAPISSHHKLTFNFSPLSDTATFFPLFLCSPKYRIIVVSLNQLSYFSSPIFASGELFLCREERIFTNVYKLWGGVLTNNTLNTVAEKILNFNLWELILWQFGFYVEN